MANRAPLVVARIADKRERARLWKKVNEVWDYDAYQNRSSREIPIVILERAARAPRKPRGTETG